jgi:cation diffusion facilitator CzcD-associated flavoprotein CzcO
MHSEQYFNVEQLPEGNVLVVGSGQSGAQIAEDLHLQVKRFIFLQEMHHAVRVFIVVKT